MTILDEALAKYNIPMPTQHIEIGQKHRWGYHNRYWLFRFEGGYSFGDFIDGVSDYVFNKYESEYSKEELDKIKRRARIYQQKAQEELLEQQNKAKEKALDIWDEANKDPYVVESHQYLLRKKIFPHGLGVDDDNKLIIPLYDVDNELWSVQTIAENGNKRFLSEGRKKGCFYPIGFSIASIVRKNGLERVCICEGYATGATIYEISGIPTIVAFDAGNLKHVVTEIRRKNPNIKIIICADNDQYNPKNTGIEQAREAIRGIDATLLYPTFKNTDTRPTDFNDLLVLEGSETVEEYFKDIVQNNQNKREGIPEGFELRDNGLFVVDKKTKELVRISNYIKVVASVQEQEGLSKLIEFKDKNNKLKQIIVKAQMFARNGEQIRIKLIENGFLYTGDTFSNHKLFEYFVSSNPPKDMTLVAKTGFHDDVYVRPDCVIGKPKDEIIIDNAIKDRSYSTKGTLNAWNSELIKYCNNNLKLMFSLSSGFASMVLNPCRHANFGCHFMGESSCGKTTCLQVASSVFGNEDYVSTWRTTDNALENMAYRHNDSLLILDEFSEFSAKKAGDVVYMLANGQGKQRLDQNCTPRYTFSWKLIFLSSGERDLISQMKRADEIADAGQKIRLLTIPIEKKELGIFDDIHGFKDAASFANYLKETSAKYHGVAAIEFMKKILEINSKNPNKLKEDFEAYLSEMKEQFRGKLREGQDWRAFEHFCFIGFAGELAIKLGIMQLPQGSATKSALSCFAAWYEYKGGSGNDEEKQIIENAVSFFEKHGHSRFYDLDSKTTDQKISNMAGYRTCKDNKVTFFLFPSVFKEEICKNFYMKNVLEVLKANGYLFKDHNNKTCVKKWTPDGSKRVYVFSDVVTETPDAA